MVLEQVDFQRQRRRRRRRRGRGREEEEVEVEDEEDEDHNRRLILCTKLNSWRLGDSVAEAASS